MSGCVVSTSEMTRAPPPPGMCTSTSTTSGTRADHLDRVVDLRCRADHFEFRTELGAHAGEKQLMVVDEEDARVTVPLTHVPLTHVVASSFTRGRVISTSVPSPGVLRISAVPPARASRSTIEPEIPRRSSATAAGSKPRPRSRTNTETRCASTSR